MQKIERYLIINHGDVEPEVRGPFVNDAEVVVQARAYRFGEGDTEDGLFRLNVIDGKPEIHTFSGGVIEDAAHTLLVLDREAFANLYWMDWSQDPAPENNGVLIYLGDIKDNLADGYDFGTLDIQHVINAAEADGCRFVNVRYVGPPILEPVHSQSTAPKYVCENCGKAYASEVELAEVQDIWSRLSPGCIFPNGQCPDPECGALVYGEGMVE